MNAREYNGTGLHSLVLRICTGWALLGGVVLLAVVGINLVSVIGASTIGYGFPGDFEMTEMGVAIAAFAFLPYCQIAGLNVTADIFTANASRGLLAFFTLLAAIVALLFAGLLLWRMYLGLVDQRDYEYTTTILQVPVWWGFVPCLISLALLILAAFATLVDAINDMTKRAH